ncbi:unnamed protein product [Protopolystoma xenopodis]|uniref:Uncharacterized protein n=1 Tax=Protopolystoma xenopodis TaxID=117903 RepID=A0A448XR74_9PLAT|nr:unnamed protein product [Protopolystoma xenopodis]
MSSRWRGENKPIRIYNRGGLFDLWDPGKHGFRLVSQLIEAYLNQQLTPEHSDLRLVHPVSSRRPRDLSSGESINYASSIITGNPSGAATSTHLSFVAGISSDASQMLPLNSNQHLVPAEDSAVATRTVASLDSECPLLPDLEINQLLTELNQACLSSQCCERRNRELRLQFKRATEKKEHAERMIKAFTKLYSWLNIQSTRLTEISGRNDMYA